MSTPLLAAFTPTRSVPRIGLFCACLAVLTGGIGIMAQGPWTDEVYMLMIASDGFVQGLHHHLSTNMLPFHPALLWAFTLGGKSLLGGRILSLLAFGGAAALLFLSARRLVGPRAAIFAVIFFSLNPLMVWHAQDARPYMLLVLLCLASLYFLLRALDGERNSLPALYLSVLCGSLTHVYFMAFAAAMGIHALAYRRSPGARRSFVTLVAAGLTAAPIVATLMILSRGVTAGFGKTVDLRAITYAMLTFGTGYAFGPTSEEMHVADPMVAVWPYLPALVLCLLLFWGAIAWGAVSLFKKDRRLCLVLMAYASLSFLFPFAVALLRQTITFNIRYVLPAVPMFILFPAHAAAAIGRRGRTAAAALLVLPVELYGLSSYYLDDRYWKEDYAAVARFLTESAGPTDQLFEGPYPRMLSFLMNDRPVGALPADGVIAASPPDGGRAFYVVNQRWISDPDARITARLEGDPGVRRVRFRGFDVFIR